MSDLISRQEALEAIAKVKNNMNIGDITHYTFDLIDAIDNLPSAEPKKGKWERHYSRPNVYADLNWHCSNCGHKSSDNWANKWNYCPNCGADMRREE